MNAGLTQEEAAQAINVTGKTLISWEKGVTHPTVDKLWRLCSPYDVQTAIFLYPYNSFKTHFQKKLSHHMTTGGKHNERTENL